MTSETPVPPAPQPAPVPVHLIAYPLASGDECTSLVPWERIRNRSRAMIGLAVLLGMAGGLAGALPGGAYAHTTLLEIGQVAHLEAGMATKPVPIEDSEIAVGRLSALLPQTLRDLGYDEETAGSFAWIPDIAIRNVKGSRLVILETKAKASGAAAVATLHQRLAGQMTATHQVETIRTRRAIEGELDKVRHRLSEQQTLMVSLTQSAEILRKKQALLIESDQSLSILGGKSENDPMVRIAEQLRQVGGINAVTAEQVSLEARRAEAAQELHRQEERLSQATLALDSIEDTHLGSTNVSVRPVGTSRVAKGFLGVIVGALFGALLALCWPSGRSRAG